MRLAFLIAALAFGAAAPAGAAVGSTEPSAELRLCTDTGPATPRWLRPYAPRVLPSTPPDRRRLSARFMGISTILLEDGETSILIDGFFSRPGPDKLFTGMSPNERVIDCALRRAGIGSLDALLVTHAHHDHGMDAGVVARKTGALLIGSESTANIALGSNLPRDRIRLAGHGDSCSVGTFRIRFISSPHGDPFVFPGTINSRLRLPADVTMYRGTGNLSFLIEHRGWRILIVGTPGSHPRVMDGVRADIVLLSLPTVGRSSRRIPRYWQDMVAATQAELVIPIHWDYFTRPLSRGLRPMGWFDRAMAEVDELASSSNPPVAVRFMRAFEPVDLIAAYPRSRTSPGVLGGAQPAGSCVSTLRPFV